VSLSITALRDELRGFVRDRDWSQFHDPKNLAMALVSEAGELAAEYRWVANTDADRHSAVQPARQRVIAEIGDVGILLLLLCDRVGVDPLVAIEEKLRANEVKYPVAESKGRSDPSA
jgi:NTP pyrophosphatase (non-canonical NTP hydrolase)